MAGVGSWGYQNESVGWSRSHIISSREHSYKVGTNSDNFLLSLVVGRRELEGSLNGYQVKGKCAVGSTP